MPGFAEGLLQVDFLPHGWCYRWQPAVVWLHVVSDLLIAFAYYAIPFSLIYIVRRRSDLVYPWMFWLFGAFILACGSTHLMSVIVVWQPLYRLDGVIKAITAVASVATAVLMLRVAPLIVALPRPEQLRVMNRRLEEEVAERKSAENEVRRLNADLEQRVQERTAELERVNQQLRESENRLRSILDTSPALVYLKDLDGRYIFVNRQVAERLEAEREDLLGKTDYELFPADAAESYRTSDESVLTSGQPVEVEELAAHRSGTRTYMSIKFPLTEESGRVYALCGISTDITERKRAEQALRRYNSELEQFAFVVSHDLQEPLRTVKSYAQMIAKRYKGKLDRDADDFIDFVIGGVDRMYALITGLQSYTELNRVSTSVLTADADAVLRETLRHMQASIQESGAELTHTFLPHVRIAPAQLGQVFQNLISNAIKYGKPGEPPRIHVSATPDAGLVEFVVRDEGIGMEMQYAEQIFGVFKRLHGRNVPGTGIGLAICKKVVEAAGGSIWVRSEPGKGTAFYFTLPRA